MAATEVLYNRRVQLDHMCVLSTMFLIVFVAISVSVWLLFLLLLFVHFVHERREMKFYYLLKIFLCAYWPGVYLMN